MVHPALFKLQPSNVLCSVVEGLVEAPACRDVDPGDSNACLGKMVQTFVVKLASVEVLRILEGLEVIDVEVLDVRMLAVSSDVATSQSHCSRHESRTITRAEATMFPRQRYSLSSVRNAECAKSSAWGRNGKGVTRQNHGTDPGDDSARNQLICLYPSVKR